MPDSFLVTYSDKTYTHTTMVRHQGTTIAFAMDSGRHICYSVLASEKMANGKSDAESWSEAPARLAFPKEIVQIGYGAAGETAIPPSTNPDAATRDFMSSTARLSALAPFQALSDGVYLYLFRQANGFNDPDMVYKKDDQGQLISDTLGNSVPLVNNTLLVDRFVLTGTKLELKREVRFRRSRSKYNPQSDTDSLDSVDMESNPFYEPTQEFDRIGPLQQGHFAVLVLPTQVPGIQRWQIFANLSTDPTKVHSWSVERAEDGLFNTRGTQLYTCPDHPDFFARTPGKCPRPSQADSTKPCSLGLVPVVGQLGGVVERSFDLDGRTITRGLSAQLYYEQEQGLAGYDQTAKPLKRDARVMLAVPTLDANAQKEYISTVDFAVSGSGQLADAPSSIALSDIEWTDPNNRSYNDVLDSIQGLEDRIGEINGILSPIALANLDPTTYLPAACADAVPVYEERLSSAVNAKYCLSRADEDRQAGRSQVGVVFCAFSTQVPGTLPVYRETPNAAPDSEYRFYWDSGTPNWTPQSNPAFYAFTSQVSDSQPVYEHTPTAIPSSDFRYSTEVSLAGWTQTRIAFYAFPPESSANHRLAPIYAVGNVSATLNLKTRDGNPLPPYRLVGIGSGEFALRTDTGVYLSADTSTGTVTTSTSVGPQERFTLHKRIALRANNNMYAYTDQTDSAIPIFASLNMLTRWTEFEIEYPDPANKNNIALKAPSNGNYVCSDISWGELVANRGVIGPWEIFTQVDLGNGQIALKAFNGNYVRAAGDTGNRLAATAGAIGPWETYTVEPVIELKHGNDYLKIDNTGSTTLVVGPPSDLACFHYTETGVRAESTSPVKDLLEVRHLGYGDGSTTLEIDPSGSAFARVGDSWGSVQRVFSGGGEITYYVDANGNLCWTRHLGARDRVLSWSPQTVVGADWGNAKHLFSAGNGVIYSVDNQDQLLWIFHKGWRDGTFDWSDWKVVRSSANWQDYKQVFSGGDEIIYAVAQNGDLHWYRHNGQSSGDASASAWEGPNMVGTGWGNARNLSCGGHGLIYFVDQISNDLRFYFHRGWKTGVFDWSDPISVDSGWTFGTVFAALPGNPARFELYKLHQLLLERAAKEAARLAERALVQNDVALSMPQVHVDNAGLTTHGGRLKFAWTNDAPLLFDAATGRLALYFRGLADQFFVAYFDTNTAKSQFEIVSGADSLRFGARMAGPSLDALAITIADGPNADTCTVTLAASGFAPETWNRVPRAIQTFANVLNGNTGSPVFVGNIGAAINATTTTLTLASGLERALVTGDTLLVGATRVFLASDAAKGDTSLSIASATLNVQAADALYLSLYDYTTHAAALSSGSRLVAVLGGTSASVFNGVATRVGADPTPAPQWVAASPGQALSFDGAGWLKLKDPTKLSQLTSASDLTLEAWVKPSKVSRFARVVSCKSSSESYSLALEPVGSGDYYQVVASVGGKQVASQVPGGIPCARWQHLAAAYHQSHALKFEGSTWLDCGADPTLDISGDLTIEVSLYVEQLAGQELGILTKGLLDDGTEQGVPYSLYLLAGSLVFTFEDNKNVNHEFYSNGLANGLNKIAVTRSRENREENGLVHTHYVLRCIVNGIEVGKQDLQLDDNVANNNQPLLIGKAFLPGCLTRSFQGEISEVRIWNVARSSSEVCRPITGREQGLVSWWRFEENQGNVAQDSKSQNHGVMKKGTAHWVANRDPHDSRVTVYSNGTPVTTASTTLPALTVDQFAVGGDLNGNSPFVGILEDVRVWKVERTREEIEENLFRRVTDKKDDLLAYFPFDSFDPNNPTEVADCGFGVHSLVKSGTPSPKSFMSTAPIGEDASAVRSALAGVKTDFHGTLQARPAVAEYGELVRNDDGSSSGSLRRGYSFIQPGNSQWLILSGYKVGELAAVWIGQIQSDPQIVGFIEGAPPVPSENLTQKNPAAFANYSGASSVEITEADKTLYTFSSSRDAGFDMNIESSFFTGNSGELVGPIGPLLGVIEEHKAKAGLKTKFENSLGWLNDAKVSTEKRKNRLSKQTLEGAWENPSDPTTRRFVPHNVGYALVQADTMDVFALRLEHNGALIAYELKPNPDIPKDWNIIVFPLNPSYVKQGTLDGKVGLVPDSGYPQAMTYSPDISYFKPIEAYRLKQWIRQREEELSAYYLRGYNAGEVGRRQGPLHFSAEDPAGAPALGPEHPIEGSIAGTLPQSGLLKKQNLVNTYVWTAEGGFFSETESTTDVRQEQVGGNYKFKGQAGLTVDVEAMLFSWFVGFKLDALFGGHLNLTVTKAKEASKSFEVKIDASGERDIALRDSNGDIVWDTRDPRVRRAKNKPGKVDGYRFMTFFMQPQEAHFDDFYDKVVDPIWLAQSNSGAAAALRGAKQKGKKPACWRVFHRVTYVSRVLPDFSDPSATPIEKALRGSDIDSNWELVQRLAPSVSNYTGDYAIFASKVHDALTNNLPEMLPHEPEILRFLCLYYGIAAGIA